MSKRHPRRKPPHPASEQRSAAEPTAAPPRRSSRPLWIVLIVVLVGAVLGVRWYIDSLTRPDRAPPSAAKENRAPTAAATPSWLRPVAREAVCCAVGQGDLSEVWERIDDAAADGWDTEVFSNAVMRQFDLLKKAITHPPLEESAVAFLTAPGAAVARLLPTSLQTTFEDPALRVQRAIVSDAAAGADPPRDGAAGLAQSLGELLASFSDPAQLRAKIKVFRVEKLPDGVRTLQTVELFGATPDGVREVNAIWSAEWTLDVPSPKLRALRVTQFETAASTGRTLYSDCTASVIAANASFRDQLLQGFNHWLDRSQFRGYVGTPAVALGDVNGDGLDDLYLCQEGGLPNLLFLQQPDGTLRDASRASGADWLEYSRAALIVDLNNDGRNDLVVGVEGGVVLAEGDGRGAFQIRRVLDTADDVMALAAADYDLDGRLDLFVGVYHSDDRTGESGEEPALAMDFVFYDARNGGPNSLWHNDIAGDDWRMQDVTDAVGLNVENYRWTLAAAWDDLDQDGDPDLYVANDFGPNHLFRNDLAAEGGRTLVDIAFAAGAEDSASGMSVAFGDYDHDGRTDLYVSNMFSYAGNRIMYQEQFKPQFDERIKNLFRRFARGNTLLKNLAPQAGEPTLKFEDRSLPAAVNRGRWAWSSQFVDVNNDGWDDLVVANGFISTEGSGDL